MRLCPLRRQSAVSNRPPFSLILALSGAVCLLAAGCATGHVEPAVFSSGGSLVAISGTVQGGQQPVSGAAIALYAAGKTAIGSAARSMLVQPVTTNANGNFTLSSFSCQAGDQVYLVATGGNSGAGANNAIALMTALGSCATLQANLASSFISVNEVTTVASIYALSGFMTGPQNLGADPANANALAAAFASVNALVSTSTGAANQTTLGNGLVPYATINSLADSVGSCINSAQGSQVCGNLFSDTRTSGNTPANTIQAVLNLAQNPTLNVAAIYQLAQAASPFQPTLAAPPASWAITVAHPNDVLVYHNDASRTGVQSYETQLTPSNVKSGTFGKLYSFAVDSYLFANPLFVGGFGMPDGSLHNIVLTATTRGTVTAFDADNNNPAAGSLWQQSLIPAGERYPTGNDYGCDNPPEAGIVGTPVIDRVAQTVYLVVKSITTSGGVYNQRLHAISLLDGSERASSPVLINPSFSTNGQGAGASGTNLPFNAQRELNRSALLLAPNAAGGNTVWIAFASHCDIGPYHGIVLGYNSANISQMTASFNDTPNGNDGGIWMGAGGLAEDSQGYLYGLSGNGTYDANTGGPDYGDSALKMAAPAPGSGSLSLSVADSFTPSNQAYLQSRDLDMGGAEALLFNDPAGKAPNLLVASDKNGYVYLLNTAKMGGYDTGTNGINAQNGDLQDWNAGGQFIYNFAFFNNVLYTSNPLEAYAFQPGTSSSAGRFNTAALANTGLGNTAASVSANGTQNALVWALDQNDVLHAYSAPNLTELYNSGQAAGGRDKPAPFVKFNSPVVANGKVYLAGDGALVVYGLLP